MFLNSSILYFSVSIMSIFCLLDGFCLNKSIIQSINCCSIEVAGALNYLASALLYFATEFGFYLICVHTNLPLARNTQVQIKLCLLNNRQHFNKLEEESSMVCVGKELE